jgi:ketosteroid isomerase-like protein
MLTKDMVEAAEVLRSEAMIAADVEAMQELMAADMIWVHGSGAHDDKPSMIAGFGSGQMRYFGLKRSDYSVRLYGDTAVAMGLMEIDGEINGLRKQLLNRFLSVWVLLDGRVQLAAWQSMRTV